MPKYIIHGLLVAGLSLAATPSSAADQPPVPGASEHAPGASRAPGSPGAAAPAPAVADRSMLRPKVREPWRWGGFLEADLGVLFMSGGTGLFAGPAYGPFRAAVGFYRFDSPSRSLGGVPDGFELKVNWLLSVDAAYFVAQDTTRGPYVRVAYQEKEQRVLNERNGARAFLRSRLAGPEIGWVFSLGSAAYLAPRLGALYYLRSPQPGGAPVLVGGQPYDNERHKRWDLYATLGLGVRL